MLFATIPLLELSTVDTLTTTTNQLKTFAQGGTNPSAHKKLLVEVALQRLSRKL